LPRHKRTSSFLQPVREPFFHKRNPEISLLRATSVAPQGTGEEILWTTVNGHSYVLQAASELNAFTDVSPLIFDSGVDESTTNFVEAGGATNGMRFYRVRLGP